MDYSYGFDWVIRKALIKRWRPFFNKAVTLGKAKHGCRRTYGTKSLSNEIHGARLEIRAQGGVIVKTLFNGQFDAAMAAGIVSQAYVDACDELSRGLPEMSASFYAVCKRRDDV